MIAAISLTAIPLLVYKMMGIDTVPVVVWPTVKKNKEEKTDAVSV